MKAGAFLHRGEIVGNYISVFLMLLGGWSLYMKWEQMFPQNRKIGFWREGGKTVEKLGVEELEDLE